MSLTRSMRYMSTAAPKYGFDPNTNRVVIYPKVRDLYKRLLFVGRDYPNGLEFVRKKAKNWILSNAGLTEEVEIKRAVSIGRFWAREMVAVIQLKKYRTLKHRYDPENVVKTSESVEQAAEKAFKNHVTET